MNHDICLGIVAHLDIRTPRHSGPGVIVRLGQNVSFNTDDICLRIVALPTFKLGVSVRSGQNVSFHTDDIRLRIVAHLDIQAWRYCSHRSQC